MNAFSLIEKELERYPNGEAPIPHPYSQAKLLNRILLFERQIYPTGKTDSQRNYKYYFDIRSPPPRVQAEIKNIGGVVGVTPSFRDSVSESSIPRRLPLGDQPITVMVRTKDRRPDPAGTLPMMARDVGQSGRVPSVRVTPSSESGCKPRPGRG